MLPPAAAVLFLLSQQNCKCTVHYLSIQSPRRCSNWEKCFFYTDSGAIGFSPALSLNVAMCSASHQIS